MPKGGIDNGLINSLF